MPKKINWEKFNKTIDIDITTPTTPTPTTPTLMPKKVDWKRFDKTTDVDIPTPTTITPIQTTVPPDIYEDKQVQNIIDKFGEIPKTKEGFIDTRVFWKTPQWALEYNRNLEDELSKVMGGQEIELEIPKSIPQLKEQALGILGRIGKEFGRLSPYETFREMAVEPEKFKFEGTEIPDPGAIFKTYIDRLLEPKVHHGLKLILQLARRYGQAFKPPYGVDEEVVESKIQKAIEKGELPPAIARFQYTTITAKMSEEQKIEINKELQKVGNQWRKSYLQDIDFTKVKDVEKVDLLDSFILNLATEVIFDIPTNVALATFSKAVGKTVAGMIPENLKQKGMAKSTGMAVGEMAKKNLISRIVMEVDDGSAIFKSIARHTGDIDEAGDLFLNRFYPGWQDIVYPKSIIATTPPVIEQMVEKVKGVPTGYKVIEKQKTKFTRGYGSILKQDLISRAKALNIKPNSVKDLLVRRIVEGEFDTKLVDELFNTLKGKETVEQITRAKSLFYLLHPERTSDDIYRWVESIKKIQGITANTDDIIEDAIALATPMKRMRDSALKLMRIPGLGGYDMGEVQNYLYRKYLLEGGKKIAYRGKAIGVDVPYIAYNRIFKTRADVISAGYQLSDSALESMTVYLDIHSKAMNYSAFTDEIAKTFGKTIGFRKRITEAGRRRTNIGKLKGYTFENKIATLVERTSDVVKFNSKFATGYFKWMNKINQIYKRLWTATSGFYIRNIYGSFSQNYIKHGESALDVSKHIEAYQLARGELKTVKIGSKVYDAKLIKDLYDLGGVGAGWYRGELLTKGQPFVKIAESIEDEARMFSFLQSLREGQSYLGAWTTAIGIHFDYLDGLTQAQKVYGRTHIPFLSWYRFNLPTQFRFLLSESPKINNIYRIWKSVGVANPEDVPEWFNQYIMMDISSEDTAKEVKEYLKLDIPFAQIGLLQPSVDALTKDPHKPLHLKFKEFIAPLCALSTPLIGVPLQIALNFDFFKTEPIPTQYKIASPVPDFVIRDMPEFLINWLELEKDKKGIWKMNAEKAKLFDIIPYLWNLAIMTGHEKFEGYKDLKWWYDQISITLGVRIFPVDQAYNEMSKVWSKRDKEQYKKEYENRQIDTETKIETPKLEGKVNWRKFTIFGQSPMETEEEKQAQEILDQFK